MNLKHTKNVGWLLKQFNACENAERVAILAQMLSDYRRFTVETGGDEDTLEVFDATLEVLVEEAATSVEQLAARIRNEMDVVAANPNEAEEWERLRNTAADVLEMYAEALRTRNAVFF